MLYVFDMATDQGRTCILEQGVISKTGCNFDIYDCMTLNRTFLSNI